MRRVLTADERLRAAQQVRKLRREGVDEKQAVAKAMSMAAAGRLTPTGDYIRVGDEDDGEMD